VKLTFILSINLSPQQRMTKNYIDSVCVSVCVCVCVWVYVYERGRNEKGWDSRKKWKRTIKFVYFMCVHVGVSALEGHGLTPFQVETKSTYSFKSGARPRQIVLFSLRIFTWNYLVLGNLLHSEIQFFFTW